MTAFNMSSDVVQLFKCVYLNTKFGSIFEVDSGSQYVHLLWAT